ncbi:LIM domain-binding protein 3-like [Colossoma macropomum]|uniref:LIM domain-binding protein 3-like n=1 Tax=Colossoma macropomum TaxID=42526 RepID=UPI001863FDA5|nr:LIM domain-binding protein 3-like [Colossoma macropomum]
MGDDEWMSRLKRFAASGIWPSDAGPVTSVTTTASPSSPVQSPRQPALTLSMFDRQRFGGTHSAVAKPNLVSQKPCQPLPCPAVTSSSASTGSTSIYTVIPSSPDETYTITPGTPRTPSPGEVSVRTTTSGSPSPSEAALRTTTAGCISPAQTPTTMSTVVASSVGEDLAGPASASFWLPVEMKNSIPVQDQRWIVSALYHAGKLLPDLKLWYEPPVPLHILVGSNTRTLFHPPAHGVDALPPVES